MSMSIGMAQGMNALISINSQLSDLQAQALSGKKINSASDGLAAYLSAKNYTDRSGRLSNVNDTLGTNLQTIKAAQKGLESIRSTVSDALDTLKAASQTQSYVAATGQTYPESDGGGTNVNMGALGAAMTGAGNLIGANFGGAVLTQGLTFSISVGTTTKYVRISTAAEKTAVAGDGTSAATAAKVVTLDDLLNQLVGAGLNVTNRAAAGANYAANFKFQLQSAANSPVSIQNVTQGAADQGTAGAVNLDTIFGNGGRAQQANPANAYTYDKKTGIGGAANTFDQKFTITGTTVTPTGGSGGQAADARRAAAAKSYKVAIDQIGQYLKSASVSGTNLLNGDILKVTFDEKGTSSSFQLQDANNNALTFTAASLGLVDAGTLASADITNNFATNDEAKNALGGAVGLNAAIDKLTNALSNLNLGDSQVAQFQATTQNRVDFNKSIVSLLNDATNSLTGADMTEVAAQTAALQVQQSFAQTILANTKQSDQSIMQLLR